MQKSILKIKHILLVILVFILLMPGTGLPESFSIKLKNSLNISRSNEEIRINSETLKMKKPGFGFNSFAIYENKKEVPYEKIISKDRNKYEILFFLSFQPNETKEIIFKDNVKTKEPKKETQAYLGQKKGYIKKDGYYTGGHFKSVDFTKVPAGYFAHDALYQFEGPGWESEKVAYRVYLDDRNRTDIFGKKVDGLFLANTGKNDLVSDGNESYQSMLSWGRDIFKVGNSLGIGSIATFHKNKVTTVSEVDSISCQIFNGNLVSRVTTLHYGWNLDKKYNILTNYSISAKSRITKVNVSIDKNIDNFCTGLAKHKDTDYLTSKGEGWDYIALWGKQTLADDNLGIAVIYNKSYLLNISEDDLSYFVILKPNDNKLTYYFCAAWEQEPNGIKSKKEFISYLNNEINKLNNPIKIEI